MKMIKRRDNLLYRVEGWLSVREKETLPGTLPVISYSNSGGPTSRLRRSNRNRNRNEFGAAMTSVIVNNGTVTLPNVGDGAWRRTYCVLNRNKFSHHNTEEMSLIGERLSVECRRIRLDGGPFRMFGGPWALLAVEPPLPEEDEGGSETSSLRDERVVMVRANEGALLRNGTPPPGSQPSYDYHGEIEKRRTLNLMTKEKDGEIEAKSEDTQEKPKSLATFRSPLAETSYDKAIERRGSAPSTPVLGRPPAPMEHHIIAQSEPSASPPTSRFSSFFSKKSFKNNPLKRTKSVTKLERKRASQMIRGDGSLGRPGVLRSSRSHESLLQPPPGSHLGPGGLPLPPNIELSPALEVNAVHPSLLRGEAYHKHCFELGNRLYSCSTREERDRWVEHLLSATAPPDENHPDPLHRPRVQNTLQVCIFEAKGLANKKRYFCELSLGSRLRGRTCTKQKSDMCFWGENFVFERLPATSECLTVAVYREGDKRKKDKRNLLGSVRIPLNATSSTASPPIENWYPLEPCNNLSGSALTHNQGVSLRIKTRFQSLEVFPIDAYQNLFKYLRAEYVTVCELLEPAVSVRTKEDVATALVQLMQKQGLATEFVTELVMADVDKIEDDHLTFRGNSMATKTMEAYMKLLGGGRYLEDTLGDAIQLLLSSSDDCEVDPSKVSNNITLQQHQDRLRKHVEFVWKRIKNSANSFPTELRQVFGILRDRLRRREDVCYNLLSASIFLRFLCPAILSPSLFNLSQEYPSERVARNLTLVAKTIQTLANFTAFGGKENYMEFLNEFIRQEMDMMHLFLREISSGPTKSSRCEFDDSHIDAARQLALLHALLRDHFPTISATPNAPREAIDRLMDALNSVQYPPEDVDINRDNSASPNAASDLNTCDDYVALSALGDPNTPPPPLAFANPMYRFPNNVNSSPSPVEMNGGSPLDDGRSSCTTSSNHSAHDIILLTTNQHSVKTIDQLMLEIETLRRQLSEAERQLDSQRRRAEEVEERLKRQKEEKEAQVKSIITRLITVEEELRREQSLMQRSIADRDAQINNLHTSNARLLAALAELRERYRELQELHTNHNNNNNNGVPNTENDGATTTTTTSAFDAVVSGGAATTTLIENGTSPLTTASYKSSSC